MVVGFLQKFLKTTDIDCPIERVTSQASFIQFISFHHTFQMPAKSKVTRLKGNKTFQEKANIWSNLTLTKLHRIQSINRNRNSTLEANQTPDGKIGPPQPPKNSMAAT